jgi:hypothetical protein
MFKISVPERLFLHLSVISLWPIFFSCYTERILQCLNGKEGKGKTIRFARDNDFYKDDIVVFFSKSFFFIFHNWRVSEIDTNTRTDLTS